MHKSKLTSNFAHKKLSKFKEDLVFSFFEGVEEVSSLEPSKCFNLPQDVVWTMWLQGEDKAPAIVRICLERMHKIFNKRLIVITKENFHCYANIPKEIIYKFEAGIISSTAFSEIIRLELLCLYGGLWIDSTVLIYKEDVSHIPFESRFLSLKGRDYLPEGEVLGLFPMFFLFSKEAGYIPLIKVRELLLYYWMKNSFQIDYFLLDYIFKYVYMSNVEFRRDVEKCPLLGLNRFLISDVVKNNKSITNIFEDPIGIYKVSYKNSFFEKNESFFKELLK